MRNNKRERLSHLDKENRMIYDRNRLEAVSVSEVIEEHPEWIRGKQEEVGKSQERINNLIHRKMVGDLVDRMIEEDGGVEYSDAHFNLCLAKWIMENIQPELVTNINEWIEGRPLSEIKICGKTVSDIMNQFGEERPISFIDAIECMIYWKQTAYRHERFCTLFFMEK